MIGGRNWRLLSNDLRPEDGGVEAAGDPELIDVLLRTRAIIATPGPPPQVSPLAGPPSPR